MLTHLTLSDRQLRNLLMRGAVGILPTDTVYGLVCRAQDLVAVKRLYEVKHREGKPGTVVAADIFQLKELGVKSKSLAYAEEYWPGATSVLVPIEASLHHITQGKNELACRVISGPAALLDVLRITGPLLTTSANMPGDPVVTTAAQAQRQFGDAVDFYVDGGDLSGNLASTLIRVHDSGTIEMLREGAVTITSKGDKML